MFLFLFFFVFQMRFGIRLSPLVAKKNSSTVHSQPRNLPVVLQVRTKCAAILAIASTSKQTQVLRRNKTGSDDILNKKNPKRMKVADCNSSKWKGCKSEEPKAPCRISSRLEKKTGESCRRFSTTERRKKPKPK